MHIGDHWAQTTHENLSLQLRDYFLVGGMPEFVARFCEDHGSDRWQVIQENIHQTVRDDFQEYAQRRKVPVLHQVYDRLPMQIGKKVKFSSLAPDERADQMRDVLRLFTLARIIHKAQHSHADGPPLGAQVEEKVAKYFWLDIGLLNRILGVPTNINHMDNHLFPEGIMAEQFVAQHLAAVHGPTVNPSLYYWLREGRTNNAEVDFLIQSGLKIIPIEVKAQKSGSLKSLMQFITLRRLSLAVKFSMELPSLQEVSHNFIGPSGPQTANFHLLTLPLYFVEQLPRILKEI